MQYFDQKKQIKYLNRRSFFLLLTKLSLFSVISYRLFDIQITNSSKYKTLSKNNQINVEILYPVRGIIKDRKGNIIASNLKVFDLYIIPEQTKNLNKALNDLSNFIDLDFKTKRQIINLSKTVKKFERIKILENLDWKTLEMLETNKNYLEGISLIEDFQRIYPQNESFSHLLGYVNKPSKKDLNLPYISNMPLLNIGKQGLEKTFNELLVGQPGNREVEVNSSGRIIREISKKLSTKGKELNLSIDSKIQKYLTSRIAEHKAGSIVLLDIETGEILSMVSTPNFNSNLIIQKPNVDYWNSLLNNSLSPLTNRSIQGLYAPGSTFKMIVAIAALKDGLIDKNDKVFCEGKIEFGDRFFHCWKTKGHGNMDIVSAIKESCDVFFYNLSIKVGIDRIAEVAKDFGLGQTYNVKLLNQKKGIIPNKKWKKNTYKESWYGGETLNAAIGQGYVLTSPFQLAIMTARIASGGKKIDPSILKNSTKTSFNNMNKYSESLKIIKDAMFKVVNESKGTANNSKANNFNFSGKTGTSQVKKITIEERESDNFRKKEIEWKNRDHALFVGYMPSEKPRYALSVVIEHGGSGAKTAAPIARDVFKFIKDTI
ncbi:penicillin-binding protein 2 [Alphaproteobacteria bacterium]|nr:penicillin-binding protein 2 [Alphaproteobacteria bacterium]